MQPRQFLDQYRHFAGLDFARVADHHVVIVDAHGAVVFDQPLGQTDAAWRDFERAVEPLRPLAVAIETNNGPAVERLLAMKIDLYPMNPRAARRFRECRVSSGVKDDALDALSFADALRTAGHDWRPLGVEDEHTKHLRLLCRDEMQFTAQRTALVNHLQAALNEYYPTALSVFDDWTRPSTWAFVLQFPTPQALLKKGRRKWENFLHANRLWREKTAEQKLDTLAAAGKAFSPTPAVTDAKSVLAICLAKQLITLQAQLDEYERLIAQAFEEHPDHDLFGSLPIPDGKTKPRLLGEIGTDPLRFDDADSLCELAGTAPVTRQSGQTRYVNFRRSCCLPLRNTVHWLADLSRGKCLWAEAYYKAKREQGKSHQTALRCLGGRWLKIIHRMIQTKQPYDGDRHMRDMAQHGSWVVQLIPAPA